MSLLFHQVLEPIEVTPKAFSIPSYLVCIFQLKLAHFCEGNIFRSLKYPPWYAVLRHCLISLILRLFCGFSNTKSGDLRTGSIPIMRYFDITKLSIYIDTLYQICETKSVSKFRGSDSEK